MTLWKEALENIVGTGENAGNPFPTVFSTPSNREIIITAAFHLLSANAFKLDQCKNFLFGKELK